ncbi:MAG: FtsQ-type POTRA domain-containing protein [Oscillospiraceae bacterium]|jgi:cell division protein FtsQ|nr:FtsQ-type POTRA domain-containing protein [Oscillospiraceae bacterium]
MRTEKRTNRIARPGWIAAITLLSLALAGAWIASSALFVIGAIQVEGNGMVSSQEVIKLSGLKFGQSMLSLDADKARAGIESNPYLRLTGISREYPSRVVIRVETRRPAAIIQRARGDSLIVDFEGNIVSLASQTGSSPELAYITNVETPDALSSVGSNITGENAPDELKAALIVINALDEQDALGTISELNAGELDNLFLVTLSGIKVTLGRADELLPEKIALMRAVLPELANEGARDGTLDVTAGSKADYRSASPR